jgi:gas vesicle protein
MSLTFLLGALTGGILTAVAIIFWALDDGPM